MNIPVRHGDVANEAPPSLNPRRQQPAEVAATGRSNREIQQLIGARRAAGGMSRFPRGRAYWSQVALLRGLPEGFVPDRENCRGGYEAPPRTTYRRRSPVNDVVDRGGLEVVSTGHPADRIGRQRGERLKTLANVEPDSGGLR